MIRHHRPVLGIVLVNTRIKIGQSGFQTRLLLVPYTLAAPFTFEKANCLSLLGIEKLMTQFKSGSTRRAVKKPVSLLCLLIIVHAPTLPYRR
jgi:hypothetical protein